MTRLDPLYAQLLGVGFLILRQAVDSGDPSWFDAEMEMLHNVPSLIGEDNRERHRYFWHKERAHSIAWTAEEGRERARSRMLTYYGPIWDEMEPLINLLLERDALSASLSEGVTPA